MEQGSERAIPEGYVKLISEDECEFLIDMEVAKYSTALRSMFCGNFLEAHTRTVRLPNFRGAVLEVVCQYLYHNHLRQLSQPVSSGKSGTRIHQPPKDFNVAPELMKETLIAATYFDL